MVKGMRVFAGEHAGNKNKNDQIFGADFDSARLVTGYDPADPDKFRLTLSQQQLEDVLFQYKDEIGGEGELTTAELLDALANHLGAQDGTLSFEDRRGQDGGFLFEFDASALTLNKQGALVLEGRRIEVEAGEVSPDSFDVADVVGGEILRLARRFEDGAVPGSQVVRNVELIFDTFNDADWKDVAEDYHYNATKDYVETMFGYLGLMPADPAEPAPAAAAAAAPVAAYGALAANALQVSAGVDLGTVGSRARQGGSDSSRQALVALDDVVLDGRTAWFWDDIVDAFSSAVSWVEDTAVPWVADNVVAPISDPQVWSAVEDTFTTGWEYTENWFNNDFFPVLSSGWNSTIDWFGNWLPNTGDTVFEGQLTNLLSKRWSYGNATLDLGLNASLEGDCDYTLPTSLYGMFDEDWGSVSITFGIPLQATARAYLDPSVEGVSLPLINEQVEGPGITLTLPQSGYTAGGQLATSLNYGVNGIVSGTPTEGVGFAAGVTPQIKITANKNGVTPNAQLKNPYFQMTTRPPLDSVTGMSLEFFVTPECEVSVGLYVPDQVPIFGGDKLATVGSTVTVPMTLDVGTDFDPDGWYTGQWFKPKAKFAISSEYSVDAKFLETLSNNGWISPLTYNLTSGTIASWDSGNIL